MLRADSVLIVGDTHGNAPWLYTKVLPWARAAGVDAILQVGDFGYWPDSTGFLKVARRARKNFGVDVWFIDGNHEHFPALQRAVGSACATTGQDPLDREPVELSPGFVYLPRGSRVEVAGKTVACVGGAVSIDRRNRVAGTSWFPDERLSDFDITAVARHGRADILITHDAPSGWIIPGLMSLRDMPNLWFSELESCDEHRTRLREVLDIVQPRMLIHGHYHSAYQKVVDASYGPLEVTGLNCEFTARWGVVLRRHEDDVSLEWAI